MAVQLGVQIVPEQYVDDHRGDEQEGAEYELAEMDSRDARYSFFGLAHHITPIKRCV